MRREMPGLDEGGLGFGIGWFPSRKTRKPSSLIERLADLQSNSLNFDKVAEGILKLDCKLFPAFRQFQERHFQLWSVGGYGQFGAPRRAPTAFFGIAWHW
jgi:pyocin large subunit-like protein